MRTDGTSPESLPQPPHPDSKVAKWTRSSVQGRDTTCWGSVVSWPWSVLLMTRGPHKTLPAKHVEQKHSLAWNTCSSSNSVPIISVGFSQLTVSEPHFPHITSLHTNVLGQVSLASNSSGPEPESSTVWSSSWICHFTDHGPNRRKGWWQQAADILQPSPRMLSPTF